MSDKKELIDLASQLQSIVDQLLNCAKEEDSDEEDSKSEDKPVKAGMIAMMLKKKMSKY